MQQPVPHDILSMLEQAAQFNAAQPAGAAFQAAPPAYGMALPQRPPFASPAPVWRAAAPAPVWNQAAGHLPTSVAIASTATASPNRQDGLPPAQDIAAAISSSLQNPAAAPTAEMIHALARAVQLPGTSETAAATSTSSTTSKDVAHRQSTEAPAVGSEVSGLFSEQAASKLVEEAVQIARRDAGPVLSETSLQAAAKAALGLAAKELELKGAAAKRDSGGSTPSEGRTGLAKASSGPLKAEYTYDVKAGDDVEVWLRSVRRRLETELVDGCSVHISAECVR